ncbi:iron-sulfur cluster assembly protein [Paraburkholderia bannensis]|uniref:Iron-binding protein IscA n=2 Tax=Burkholderiaceae TaxID=119060 RepID=A0A7W9TWC2_9BURK|nr:iron-sulfur cluster assembly protein [Paraburkholderia sp. WP4_3_2]MBB6101440.1 iron-sulfur cluster assembly protein [Paraburkholderia bannensis]
MNDLDAGSLRHVETMQAQVCGRKLEAHGMKRGENVMAISLTEKAAQHVQKYLTRRGKGVGLRLGVRTTGCSGLAYKLEYVDELAAEDNVFESHGVKVIVDPKSLSYIDGTQLDFVREGLNEGFKFNNPNVKDECGCGESFRV